MNNRATWRLGLGVFLAAVPATAQEPRALTEREVVNEAVAHNPSLHVALLRAQQSRYSLNAEQALFTPVLGATAGYTHARTPSLVGTDGVRFTQSDTVDLGASVTKPFAYGTVVAASVSGQRSSRTSLEQAALLGASGPGYALIGRLSATQPLLRGSGTAIGLYSLRQAKLSLSANQLAAQQAASALLAQVMSAYWELWYAAEVVRIDEASRELARVQQEQASQQVASGALAPASALPYATQLAQLEEAVLAAKTDVRQRELALAQSLGSRSRVADSLVAADAPSPTAEDEPSQARAVEEALANSYERKQLQAQLAIVREQLKIAGDPLRPRLDVDAYVQAQGLGNRRVPPAFEQVAGLDAVSAHVGLTFELPLSDTRRSSQIQAAQFAAHVAEKQIEAGELSIRANVASAIAKSRAAREKLLLAQKTEQVAKQQAEAERARFLAGGSIAITVQQAEDAYRQAQLRVQRARVDLVLANLSLAELRGLLLTRYADAVKALPASERIDLSTEAVGNF